MWSPGEHLIGSAGLCSRVPQCNACPNTGPLVQKPVTCFVGGGFVPVSCLSGIVPWDATDACS